MTSASEAHCPSCGRRLPRDTRVVLCPVCEFSSALADVSAAPLQPSPATGLGQLGDYELLEEIAQGGMGIVYRARQVSLNRIVAVKVIRAGLGADSQFVQRFRTEAEAVARLQHPNIIAIHEVSECEGRHFFSMEYVDGPNLHEVVRLKPLPAKRAASCVETLAKAIDYAHRQGVLHRDLKPSNVLVDAADEPKITDFGLAKMLSNDTELTLSGQVLGTPQYLAPEQASGRHGQVGPWSDVYGLGAILYYLLTGRPMFQGQELTEVLDQVLHCEPVSPRLLNRSVPRDLETICLKSLEKAPARRYSTAIELAEDLGRHLRSETILARPVSSREKVWRWCRRKPALAAALAGCALALIMGMAGMAWQWRRAEREGQVARRNLYGADMLLAQQAFEENNFGRVEQLLRTYSPRRMRQQKQELRGWEWRYLWGQIESEELYTLGSHSNTVTYLAFSPDGRWLASSSHYEYGNDVRIWDLSARRLVACLPQGRAQRVNIVAFSHDAQTLAVADYSQLRFYRPPNWREPVAGMTISNRCQSIAYSRDGRLLVVHEGLRPSLPYQIRVMDARDLRTIALWPGMSARNLVLSPDGRYAADQGRSDDEVIVYDLSSGEKVAKLPGVGPSYRQGNIAFSPDGSLFAVVLWGGVITGQNYANFYSVPGFKLLKRLPESDSHFTGIAFGGDSQRAYLACADQSIAVYDVSTWARVDTLHGHRDEVWCVAVSPDGTQLASGGRDQTIRLWSTARRRRGLSAWSLPSDTREVYLADDGQTLATLSTNEVVHVRRTSDFKIVGEMAVPSTNRVTFSNKQWSQVALAPGGAHLAMATEANPNYPSRGPRLSVFELPGLRHVREFPGLRTWAAGLTFSPGGEQLAATGTFGEWQALVWEVKSGRLLHTLTNVPGRSGLVRFSPRQTWLAIRLDDITTWGFSVGLWKFPRADRQRVLTKPRHRIIDMAFSPDEQFLATAGEDASVSLWSVATGQRVCDLTGQLTFFSAVAWSPQGDRMAAGGEDGTITIWDTTSHQQVGRLRGHARQILGLAFLPDGNGLVSVSMDSFRIWRAVSLADARADE